VETLGAASEGIGRGGGPKVVENESRDDPYLGFHFHEVSGADGTVLKDVGRDILFENKHPFSIEPLCQALA